MNTLDTLLKNSLLALYADDESIVECLRLCDFSEINSKFKAELFQRINYDDFTKMNDILHSKEYIHYRECVDSAAYACTREIANLIAFAIEQKGDVH